MEKTIILYMYTYYTDMLPVFCPGYLEWRSDSNLHLVLFTQHILNTVSVAYIQCMYYLRGS